MDKFVLRGGKLAAIADRGNAVRLTRSTDSGLSVAATAALNLPNAFTVECWFFPFQSRTGADYLQILERSGSFLFRITADTASNDQAGYINFYSYAKNFGILSSTKLRNEAWNHAACTFDCFAPDPQVKLYLNAQLVGTMTHPEALPAQTTSGPGIGLISSNGNARTDGFLDELRYWNYARSAAEIAANYRLRLPSPLPGLVMRLGFDELSGNTFLDTSGYGHHGSGSLSGMSRVGSTAPLVANYSKLLTR